MKIAQKGLIKTAILIVALSLLFTAQVRAGDRDLFNKDFIGGLNLSADWPDHNRYQLFNKEVTDAAFARTEDGKYIITALISKGNLFYAFSTPKDIINGKVNFELLNASWNVGSLSQVKLSVKGNALYIVCKDKKGGNIYSCYEEFGFDVNSGKKYRIGATNNELSSKVGNLSSLVIDSKNRPHVIFTGDYGVLMHAYQKPESNKWMVENQSDDLMADALKKKAQADSKLKEADKQMGIYDAKMAEYNTKMAEYNKKMAEAAQYSKDAKYYKDQIGWGALNLSFYVMYMQMSNDAKENAYDATVAANEAKAKADAALKAANAAKKKADKLKQEAAILKEEAKALEDQALTMVGIVELQAGIRIFQNGYTISMVYKSNLPQNKDKLYVIDRDADSWSKPIDLSFQEQSGKYHGLVLLSQDNKNILVCKDGAEKLTYNTIVPNNGEGLSSFFYLQSKQTLMANPTSNHSIANWAGRAAVVYEYEKAGKFYTYYQYMANGNWEKGDELPIASSTAGSRSKKLLYDLTGNLFLLESDSSKGVFCLVNDITPPTVTIVKMTTIKDGNIDISGGYAKEDTVYIEYKVDDAVYPDSKVCVSVKQGNKVDEFGPFDKSPISLDVKKYKDGKIDIGLKAYDGSGIESKSTKSSFMRDTTPPATTLNPDIKQYDYWLTKGVNINLSAIDNASGAATIYYKKEGSEQWTPYSCENNDVKEVNVLMDKEGAQKLHYYSVDKLGNPENSKEINVKIDSVAPVITASFNEEPVMVNNEKWFDQNVIVTLEASDGPGSGVVNIKYQFNGDSTWGAYHIPLTYPNKISEGKHIINSYGTDLAKNNGIDKPYKFPINVDASDPIIANFDRISKDSKETKFSYEVDDTGSGIKEIKIKIDDEEEIVKSKKGDYTWKSILNDGKHTATLVVADNVGHEKTSKPITFYIDTVRPKILKGILYPNNAYIDIEFSEKVYGGTKDYPAALDSGDFLLDGTAKNVVVIDTVTTMGDGKTIRVNLKLKDQNKLPDGTETMEIKPIAVQIFDKAGNDALGSETTGVIILNDKTPPEMNAIPDQKNLNIACDWYSQDNVVVTFVASDAGSGLAQIRYHPGGEEIIHNVNGDKQYTIKPEITFEGKHNVSYWAKDNIGLTSDQKFVQINIDASVPVIPEDGFKQTGTGAKPAFGFGKISDALSGLQEIRITIDGKTEIVASSQNGGFNDPKIWEPGPNYFYTWPHLLENGKYIATLIVTDKVNHSKTKEIPIEVNSALNVSFEDPKDKPNTYVIINEIIYTNANPTISGVIGVGNGMGVSSVSVTDNGTPIISDNIQFTNNSFNCKFKNLSPATHTIEVTVTDDANNAASASMKIEVDKTAPSVKEGNSSSPNIECNGIFGQSKIAKFYFNITDDKVGVKEANIHITWIENGEPQDRDIPASFVNKSEKNDVLFDDKTPLDPSNYNYTITLTDRVDNKKEISGSFNVLGGLKVDGVELIDPNKVVVNNVIYTKSTQPTVSWTVLKDEGVVINEVSIADNDNKNILDNDVNSYSFNNLSEGGHKVIIGAKAYNGDVKADDMSIEFTVDLTPPVIDTFVQKSKGAKPEFSYNVNDGDGSGIKSLTVEIRNKNNDIVYSGKIDPFKSGELSSCVIDAELASGSYSATLIAEDWVGWKNSQKIDNIELNNLPAPSVAMPVKTGQYPSTTITLSWTGGLGDGKYYRVYRGTGIDDKGALIGETLIKDKLVGSTYTMPDNDPNNDPDLPGAGAKYYYQVKVVSADDKVESGHSNSAVVFHYLLEANKSTIVIFPNIDNGGLDTLAKISTDIKTSFTPSSDQYLSVSKIIIINNKETYITLLSKRLLNNQWKDYDDNGEIGKTGIVSGDKLSIGLDNPSMSIDWFVVGEAK